MSEQYNPPALDLLESLDALDSHGQELRAHSAEVCGHLNRLHLDSELISVAVFASSELNLAFMSLAERHLTADSLALLKNIHRVRQLMPFKEPVGVVATRQSIESLRRMFMALAADTRVVIFLLASRLVTLTFYAQTKRWPQRGFAQETLDVFAPLANRLGLWQIKWQLEDFGLRFSNPERYKFIATALEQKRNEREAFIDVAQLRLTNAIVAAGMNAQIAGRAKHIFSIHQKMLGKSLAFEQIMDLRALRVLVDSVPDCYAVLSLVQSIWEPVASEFDDYIARPKANGYQSLHTVVRVPNEPSDSLGPGPTLEIQIRTVEMHEYAEFGVAAHWRYKETKQGDASTTHGKGPSPEQIAAKQLSWMRQLLSWQQELGHALLADSPAALMDDYLYVFTPDARVIELARNATAIDFAYHVHTSLGHRCRGAKVDGQLVSLITPLKTGQTIEIVTARSNDRAGPSRDWLNPELGFIATTRARNKVRSWFNAQALDELTSQGRTVVEKALQREGATSLPLDELAKRLGFEKPENLFAAIAREEVGPRVIEETIRKALGHNVPEVMPDNDIEVTRIFKASDRRSRSDVLVVGVDLLLTQLARCCRPVPPDAIAGYVTRGKGISIHRQNCLSFKAIALRQPEKVLETDWDTRASAKSTQQLDKSFYPVQLAIDAVDRQGLLRDITDVLARQKINVTAVQSQSKSGLASIRMTVEVRGLSHLAQAVAAVRGLKGVTDARRR